MLRAKSPRSVALGSVRQGELALARKFLDPVFLVVRASQRREESDEVVDISLGQGERLDVFVKIEVVQSVALVVVRGSFLRL